MKITKHPTDNNSFNIAVNKFELEVLSKVSYKLIGGAGKVREVFSDKNESLYEQSCPFVTGREVFNVYSDIDAEGNLKDRYYSALYLEDIFLKTPLENPLKPQNKRDQSGRFTTNKKYLTFRYPNREARLKYTKDELTWAYSIRSTCFDKRKIFNPYKENGYLYGNDVDDGMKLKKFCLDKVFGRRYSDV